MPRILKWGAVVAGLLIGLVITLPTFLSAGFVREQIESRLSAALGAEVRIESYSLGWLSGFTLGELRIDQPPGFDLDGPALELDGMSGDISFLALLRGRFKMEGTVEGLRVRFYQRADGSSNFGELAGGGRQELPEVQMDRSSRGNRELKFESGTDLNGVHIDLRVVDAEIDIEHEQHGLLESMRHVEMTMDSHYGTSNLHVEMSSELHRSDSEKAGALSFAANIDTSFEKPTVANYKVAALDLARYRPLLASLLQAGDVTEFAGVVDGGGMVTVEVPQQRARLEGNLEIAKPRFAGALFAGMDIGAERWVIQPDFELSFADDGLKVTRAEKLRADFGFAVLRGMPATEAAAMVGGRSAFGLSFTADLAQLMQFGGPIPPWASDTTGSTKGRVALAMDGEASVEDLAATLLERLVATVELHADERRVEGYDLKGLRAKLDLAKGAVKATASADVAGGPLQVSVDIASMQAKGCPGDVALSWDGAQLAAPAVELLRYAVPVLAGLDPTGQIEFSSGAACKLSLHGPLFAADSEDLLGWLSKWTGRGDVNLTDGGFVPSAEIARLFELANQSGRLLFSDISTNFTIGGGYIETGLLKFTRDASAIELRGKTRLDGALDYTVDITRELSQHRDGKKLLERLGGKFPEIGLGGTLSDPVLRLPTDKLLQQGAQNAVDGLLQKGLEKLLKKKRE